MKSQIERGVGQLGPAYESPTFTTSKSIHKETSEEWTNSRGPDVGFWAEGSRSKPI